MAPNYFLLVVLFLHHNQHFGAVSGSRFIIERNITFSSNGTISNDVITNPGGCFRPKTCPSLAAICYNPAKDPSIAHCCFCECTGRKNVFYSLLTGCIPASSAVQKTTIADSHCKFFLKSPGPNAIPTVVRPLQLNHSESELMFKNDGNSTTDSDLPGLWCFPRRIYYLTKFGKERLLFENSCLEVMKINPVANRRAVSVNRFLEFTSRNDSDWEIFSGKLLKIEIICNNTNENSTKITSCIVIRVNGSYDDDEVVVSHHSPMVCPPAPPYIPPPTTTPPTPSKRKSPVPAHIIGGVVGAVLLCIATVVVIYIIIRRRKSRGQGNLQVEMAAVDANEPFLDGNTKDSEDATEKQASAEEVESDKQNPNDAKTENTDKKIEAVAHADLDKEKS